MTTFLKSLYAQPRPYMLSDNVRPHYCAHEYGQPSGHSLFSAGFAMGLFLDFAHGEWQGKKVSNLKYYGCLAMALTYTFLEAFDRLYLGVHSIDQIVFGLLLGTWSAFFFHYCIRDKFMAHIECCLTR